MIKITKNNVLRVNNKVWTIRDVRVYENVYNHVNYQGRNRICDQLTTRVWGRIYIQVRNQIGL